MRHALILAGGRSTRLWPLARPKQFLPLAGDQSLLGATWDRLDGLVTLDQRWIVGGSAHRRACEAILGQLGSRFIAEPEGRNTAPAIGLGCVHLNAIDPDAVVAILPADHHVTEVDVFQRCLRLAFERAENEDCIVTLGIRPSHGATGYGYLRLAEAPGPEGAALSGFVEKPDADKAQTMVAWGDHLWNAGIFVARVARLLAEFETQMPETFAALESVAEHLGQPDAEQVLRACYSRCEATSIDYGVMEGASGLWCIPTSCGWSDLGSWTGLAELWPLDGQNNAINGDAQLQQSRGNVVYVAGGPPVAVRGVDDLVIVSTAEGVLVIPKDRCEEVRHLVAARQDP
ncbi:MAG: mannose-1-phosphate guanylyltransferase [Myxococcales bacterium]|nr:mannose-1-phosphate guanylyltransferase [Myxococcales bacterium]